MWRNTLLMAFRLMLRNRVYAAINIGGLALGLAGCLIILGYIRYEQSYDSWLADHGRVFQVQTTLRPPGQPVVDTQASSFPVGEQLAGGFPQIEAVTGFTTGKTVTEHDGQPMFLDGTTVDANIFKVLDLPFAQGSAETALPDTNSIVILESDALRLLGTRQALGRLLSLGAGEGKRDYRITGVLKDLPRNTSLKLGILFHRDTRGTPAEWRGWGNFDLQHYVKLRPGASADAVNAGLPAWERRAIPPETIDGKPASMADILDFRLVPITGVHLGKAQQAALRPGGDPRALATFGIVALLTLGMAVMNFVNLTTARAAQRAREVALRKVLGATRGQLILQFILESLMISSVAMLIGLSIVELATPWISRMLGADLDFVYFGERGMVLPVLALLGITALAGGIYPAIHLSRFKPAQVLHANRGSAETRGSGRLRTALVVFQFAIAIGLIASTVVIGMQTRFVETFDPGYRRDGLIQIANAWRFTQGSEYEAARAEMLKIPGVTNTGRAFLGLGGTERRDRLMRNPGAADAVTMGYFGIDAELLQTMDIGLLAGRLLGDKFADRIGEEEKPDQLARRGINVVVNRAAAARLGYRDPQAAVGKAFQIAFDGWVMVPATIAGVVEDTRFRTAREAIEPMVFAYDPARTAGQVMVRYANARPGEIMAALGKIWRKFEPEIPFEARFADDIVRELYAADRARTLLFAGFSLLAVLIACLGLYSLAAFATERRTKEIGIRKVVGAKVRDIVRLLVWQFSKPVVLANLIAWPVAWWAMRDWLNTFDARIALGPTPFALAGILAFAIAVATVAGQSIRVARMNPIHALRYE